MSYPAIVGFIMMLVIIWILIKQKTSTIFAFTVIPIIAAVILGKGPQDIGNYLTKGFAMTIPVSLIMLFSLPHFMLMADTGLFNGIVRRILKRISLTPIVLTVLTLIVSIIVGFDVSITSIYLIAIPLFLPFYKRLKMDPLMFLFTNDTWYYVLLPIVISLMNEYHVSPIVVIATLFFNMGAMLTPIAQPQIYLGIDLTHGAVTFDRYAKYAFLPIWGLSIVLLVLGLLTGSFR